MYIKNRKGDRMYEYDYHNLNGFTEGIATYNALKRLGHVQPFVLSRSTTMGAGKYMYHWTGDSYGSWEFLQISIPNILSVNM